MTAFLIALGKLFRPIFLLTMIAVILIVITHGGPASSILDILDTPLAELTLRQVFYAAVAGAITVALAALCFFLVTRILSPPRDPEVYDHWGVGAVITIVVLGVVIPLLVGWLK
jgi:uncharacterized membrane protein